jgi:Family of unknown function (DUF6496)
LIFDKTTNRKNGGTMPEQETMKRAEEDAREGKSPSTQAGEFVREEMHHIREGKHGARSTKQAIAIGLSKARRAGVELQTPKGPSELRRKAEHDTEVAENRGRKTSRKRSRATLNALKREPKKAAGHREISLETKKSAAKRGKQARSASASKAARTRRAA